VGDSPKLDPNTEREIRAYNAHLTRLARAAKAAGAGAAPAPAGGDRDRALLESLRALTVDIGADGRIAHVS
jgi:hypothetical protein